MDTLTKRGRSRLMARVRSTGNKSTELRLIALMHGAAITGWRRHQKLPGTPDFAFPKAKLAVFVDGDFWHGHPATCRIPRTNRNYWLRKIHSNRQRDALVIHALRRKHWRVLRVWESDLRNGPASVIRRLRAKLYLRLPPCPESRSHSVVRINTTPRKPSI